jgi:homoserine acetyltransferase
VEFIDDITNNLDVGRQTDGMIMDFSKAFDKVSHCLLTHKLDHYGARGKNNIWIRNVLSNRKQVVVVEGETSDYINVESGVP